MKVTAAVISEALSSLGEWRLISEESSSQYAFPRLFTGAAQAQEHAVILSPELLRRRADEAWEKCLLVLTAPSEAPELPDGPTLIPAEPVSEEAVWNCLTALYDRMERWDEALSACGGDLSGIQRMLDESAKEMGGAFVLIDVSYHVPAYTSTGAVNLYPFVDRESARATDKVISALAEDPQMSAVRDAKGVQLFESNLISGGPIPTLFRNMFREGETAYFNRLLFLRLSGTYSQTDRYMMEHLARKVERIAGQLSTYSVPLSDSLPLKQQLLRVREPDFLQDSNALNALSPMGWKRDDSYRFYIFSSLYSKRDAGITDYILRCLEKLIPASCGAADGERILLLQNVTRASGSFFELRPALVDFLRENVYKVGISNEFNSYMLIRGAFAQAEAAMRLGGERHPMLWYYLFETYLDEYLVWKAPGGIPAEMLLLPALEQLRRHDREHGTKYAETLRVLSEENYNTTHAARRLYIHRSSLQDRMERIRQIAGLDLDDADVRGLLWFSFRLLEQKHGQQFDKTAE